MKVIKHGNAYLGTRTCKGCRCKFEYSEADINSYYDRENKRRVVCLTCPECGEEITLEVIDYGERDI